MWVRGGIAGMALGFATLAQAAPTQTLQYGLFSDVHVAMPSSTVQRTLILISDRDGWNARAETLAQALSADGTMVIGIDLPTYLKQLYSIKTDCALPSAHVQELSDWMQRHQGVAAFSNPILLGDGSGASFAYAVAAQAPAGTFAGLVTLGWDNAWRSPQPLCAGDAGALSVADGAHGSRLVPVMQLPPPWLPLPFAPGAHVDGLLAEFAALVPTRLTSAAGAAANAAVEKKSAAQLSTQIAAWQAQHSPVVALPDDVADLPLVEVMHQGAFANRVAVILSGDGGWAGLDIAVAEQMAQRGIDVVGLSTIKFFWHTRSPEEAADALTRIVQHYGETRPGADFVVIGYSFGASLAPVVVNRVPAQIRARISAQVLISPDAEAVFEIHVGDWFGSTHHDGAIPLGPEIARSTVRTICVRGHDEGEDSFCAKLIGQPHVSLLELPGGHHYDGNYAGLGAAIFDQLKQAQ